MDGLPLLRPDEQVFEAMVNGWRSLQLARNLSPGYVGDQERTVRAFARHADAMPWQWTPQHVDEWSADLRAVRGCVRSTLRNYQGAVRQFCDFLTNPAYGWTDECLRHFGTHPVQVVYEWNAAAHADEAEGEPERRAFTRPELEAFFDHADEEVLRVRGKGRKGWLPAFRDAPLFKAAYAYGLRRNETRMLDLTDFGRNPQGREFGEYGTLLVRYGKAKKGSPPKRRSVLTVWHWTPHTIEEWISEVRPGMQHSTGRTLWLSERGPRVGVQRLDSRFAAYRDAAGLIRAYVQSRQHLPYASSRSSRWLLPGRQPGQPMNPVNLQAHLREIGVPPQRGRTSAIRQLVLQAPAPVIAKALGYHDKTATRLVTEAGGTWSRYAPGDHRR
ncbi:tyrosine-type recombinase/integrase [Streptomyces sp. WM4235]|uniref:tyrosine-type recombinase/integrase n=1 Tax=Streptomyces sp. WM4235 TaxID=1415551 RepID=UPI0006AF98C8|nr:site-specific integrase [Streptomyces sp. WM4235]